MSHAGLSSSAEANCDELAAENTRLKQRVESLTFMLRNLSVVPLPLGRSRQDICEAVVASMADRSDRQATVYDIAQAVLQAAVTAGWIERAVDEENPTRGLARQIAHLVQAAEQQNHQMLAFLLDAALAEARRVMGP